MSKKPSNLIDTICIWYDARHVQEQPTCQKNIVCNNAEGCGRRSCPARSVNVSYFVRKVLEG